MPLLPLLLALQALAPAPAPAPAADSLTGPGVSAALADYRRARVRDVRYDLSLDVTARDTARGRVIVRFVRRGDGDAILDFRGPRLTSARVNGRAVEGLEANGAHIRVPAAALRTGENAVELAFASLIAPAGASIIRFHDATDGADYLYTLLVPADANALFPCFDQPDLKARVTLSLRLPRAWKAVANGAQVADSASDSAHVVRFARTRPISTYLIAFAAGPWATHTRTIRGRPLTMYVRASRAAEVERDSLIAINARALDWLERYFARPYPFGKYDFVLAPAFPFGGMEHPGAVFYNEEQSIYREQPTQTQRLGRTATIYHEVAHQWFGDLVTMRWFDDLWLKEGFATYMAAKMQDALDPRAMAWKTFYLRNKPPAYAVDVTAGTTPVWQQLANLDQAKSNYGAIVYNKAPSVIKQLNYLVGDSAFRAGLRVFVARHAYGNATWQDLLGAVGRAAQRDLAPWGAAWILRPGIPVLEATPATVAATNGGGSAGVRLTQRPVQALSGELPWPMRTELLAWSAGAAAPVRRSLALSSRDTTTTIAGLREPALLFPNAGDHAYAVTLLDSGSVAWTEAHLRGVSDGLLRAMLWGALWDLVREARYAPVRYLGMVRRELPHERDEQIVSAVLGRAAWAATRYLGDVQQVAEIPALEAVLEQGFRDTSRVYGIRKSHLDALIAIAATPRMLSRLDAMLDSATVARIPLRSPTRWAIVTTLVERGAIGAEQRLAAEAKRDSTSEGRRRAFVAGAARPAAESKADYFRRYFADSTLNEDWATASLGAFNAPSQSALSLPYLVPALDSLPWIQRNRRIFFLGNWLSAFLGGHTSAAAAAQVDAFLASHPALAPDLRAKLLQSADELTRTVAVRRAYAAEPPPAGGGS